MAYDRNAAVRYAHQWAYLRNPRYGVFDEIGGDCTNFVSQCLFAGCGIMQEQPGIGWFYRSMARRSPAWTGVFFLHRFLTENRGRGPFAGELPIEHAQPGDVIQLAFAPNVFTHACVVVQAGEPGDLAQLLIAAHTMDCDMRPIDTYVYSQLRLLHILGARM